MKFDLWTIALQIINFGVLLLILKRILYKPVREIMERRRAQAVSALEQAENARKAAQELLAKAQVERQALEDKRGQLLDDMKTEIAQQREKMLAETDLEVQRHIAKERALFAAEKTHQMAETREQALAAVTQFAGNVFAGLADAELHQALLRRLLDEVEKIGADFPGATRAKGALNAEAACAYPLGEEGDRLLREALESATACQVNLKTTIDRELLAGVKVLIGDWVYDASLKGQLTTFMTKVRRNQ